MHEVRSYQKEFFLIQTKHFDIDLALFVLRRLTQVILDMYFYLNQDRRRLVCQFLRYHLQYLKYRLELEKLSQWLLHIVLRIVLTFCRQNAENK